MNEMNMTELNVYSFISADCFCIFMLAFCFEGLPGFVFVPSLYYTSDGVRCDSLAHCTWRQTSMAVKVTSASLS